MKKYLMLAALLTAAGGSYAAAEVRKVASARGKNPPVNAAAPAKTPGRDGWAQDGMLSPDVIGAVSNVLAISHLVSRSREMCGAAIPSSQKKFTDSARNWEQRNAAVIVQKIRVMAHDDQVLVVNALQTDAQRKTDAMLRPVAAGSRAEQAKWCEQAFGDVDRGQLDLVGRASIAPLMRLVR